jgi:hypothetical protein
VLTGQIKQFQHGRTEALRSVTPQSVAFARAMLPFNSDTVLSGSRPSNAAELRSLLEAACQAHVKRMEEVGNQTNTKVIKKRTDDRCSARVAVALTGTCLPCAGWGRSLS